MRRSVATGCTYLGVSPSACESLSSLPHKAPSHTYIFRISATSTTSYAREPKQETIHHDRLREYQTILPGMGRDGGTPWMDDRRARTELEGMASGTLSM